MPRYIKKAKLDKQKAKWDYECIIICNNINLTKYYDERNIMKFEESDWRNRNILVLDDTLSQMFG